MDLKAALARIATSSSASTQSLTHPGVVKDLGPVLKLAIDSRKTTVIVCKCDSGNIKLPVITIAPVVIRDRFMKAVLR